MLYIHVIQISAPQEGHVPWLVTTTQRRQLWQKATTSSIVLVFSFTPQFWKMLCKIVSSVCLNCWVGLSSNVRLQSQLNRFIYTRWNVISLKKKVIYFERLRSDSRNTIVNKLNEKSWILANKANFIQKGNSLFYQTSENAL